MRCEVHAWRGVLSWRKGTLSVNFPDLWLFYGLLHVLKSLGLWFSINFLRRKSAVNNPLLIGKGSGVFISFVVGNCNHSWCSSLSFKILPTGDWFFTAVTTCETFTDASNFLHLKNFSKITVVSLLIAN